MEFNEKLTEYLATIGINAELSQFINEYTEEYYGTVSQVSVLNELKSFFSATENQ